MLSHLLHLEGIDSIILENRSRDYIEGRIRAGLIEHWARDLLIDTGAGERLQRESLFHDGLHFCFAGALHHVDFRKLVGKGVTVYGQQEVIKDLVARRLADGGQILFEVGDVSVHDIAGKSPTIHFNHAGKAQQITVTSSAAATASMASAGQAFPTAYSRSTTASTRLAGSASCRNRHRPTTN